PTPVLPLSNLLDHWKGGLQCNRIELDSGFTVPACPALHFTPIPLRSAAPPYSPHRNNPHPGDNIGLLVRDTQTGGVLFYAPGLGQLSSPVHEAMAAADCLLVDGTLWREDEMIHAGVGTKLGSEMGHLPQSGEGGMIEVLSAYPQSRRVLTHINNTNPILDEDSAERAELARLGIEVAHDGMVISL